jgi:hypothetical protein
MEGLRYLALRNVEMRLEKFYVLYGKGSTSYRFFPGPMMPEYESED